MPLKGKIYFAQNDRYPAQEFRTHQVASTGVRHPGVVSVLGGELLVSVKSAMTLRVAAGTAWVPQGDPQIPVQSDMYFIDMPEDEVTIDQGAVTGDRIDLVLLKVVDTETDWYCYVDKRTGTPATSGQPSPPTLRPGELLLAEVRVKAGTKSLTAEDIDNNARTRRNQVGRATPIPHQLAPHLDAKRLVGSVRDELVMDTTNKYLRRWDGSAWLPLSGGVQVLRDYALTTPSLTETNVFHRYRIPAAPHDRSGFLTVEISYWSTAEHAASYNVHALIDGKKSLLAWQWWGNAPGVAITIPAELEIPARREALIEYELAPTWPNGSARGVDVRSLWYFFPGAPQRLTALPA
ncbi:hypothetical protein GCM10012275_08100 [Longimycelium tulufanense]|uniref:Uncharacterized protein n=1 Tax=Longimycelium tulufanense TaxID=907463 RepID=A0A8J3C878_9PSEU|nr:hypothetical protein [Longimycelium tulufanense]GGM39611.1 hypothetical protein GCM10012275_08100 [Longimycelium tulufanense]